MRANNVIDSDVDIEELAKLTKKFSGAEINGLVKAALSFAFNRYIKVGTMASISADVENMKVRSSSIDLDRTAPKGRPYADIVAEPPFSRNEVS
jgi:SpoVK/Ycf46/Vps4 family AAA+-type ATPase